MLSVDPQALHDTAIFCLGMAAAIHEFASDDACPDVDAARDLEAVYWDHREAPLSAVARRLSALHGAPVQYGSFVRPNAHLICFDFARHVLDAVWIAADPDGFKRAALDGFNGSVRMDLSHFTERWPAVAEKLRSLHLPDHREIAAAVQQEAARLSTTMMTWTNYDRLCVRVLDILTGDILPLPSWNDLERHEQQIAIAVSEATGITPEYWAKLNHPSREPWLEKTIHLLTKQQPPADPEDGPRVVLRAPGERPVVCDVEKGPLTLPQYDVVKALIDAGERGLSKDDLDHKSKHGDARKILKRLAESDPDWTAVIHFPGKAGRGYRIG